MKMTSKLAILALALSAGVAAAAPAHVEVGANINNQAQVDFTVTDPASNTTTDGTSLSNVVTTTITAQPGFTIKQDTGDSSLIKTGVTAGTTGVTYSYVVTNTGNTPIVVNLSDIANPTTYTSDATPDTIKLNGTNGPITITLQPNTSQTVTMTYDIPGTNPANSYGRDLSGTATYDPAWVTGGTFTPANATSTVVDASGAQVVDKDNENHTTVINPTNITPYHPPVTDPTVLPEDPNNGGITPSTDPKDPNGTGPGYTTPTDPANPTGPTTPVYVDPTTGTQTAYPTADTNSDNDTVTIPSGATNNTGTNQNITVGPAVVPSTAPTGTTAEIINPATDKPFVTGDTATNPDGTPLLDSNGNPVLVTVDPVTGAVTFNNVPDGATPAYDVKITYPDTDGTGAATAPIVVDVPIKNGDGTQVADPVFVVKPPNAQFANSTGSTTDQAVSAGAVDKPVTPTTTGPVVAVFPMDVYNNGTYSDAYNLTATTSVPSGSVKYYATAAEAAAATPTDTNNITATNTIDPGKEQTVYAAVFVPANTVAGQYTVSQNITSPTSNIVRDYNSDTVTVGVVQQPTNPITDVTDPNYTSNPLFPLSKTVTPTTAKPGDVLTYTITGTNKYNVPTCKNIFKELDGSNTNIFANSTFDSVNATASGMLDNTTGTPVAVAGQVLYSTDGGATWGTSAAAGATSLWVGLDANNNNTIDSTDCLAIGGNVSITLKMKVN